METNEEIRSTIEQIKAQVKAKEENVGKSDDEIDEIILDGFLEALDKGEMSDEDLLGIMDVMGYEPTEEFAAELESRKGGEGETGDVSEEDLEETRTIDSDDEKAKEDFKEDIDEVKEKLSEEDGEEIPDDDEDAQREAASKLFGTDLRKKED